MTRQSSLRPAFRMALGLAVAVQAAPVVPAYAGAASHIPSSNIGTLLGGTSVSACGGGTSHNGGGYQPKPPMVINKSITINKPLTLNNNIEINKS